MNKKGFASIVLGIYLLLVLFVLGSVLYGVQYLTGLFATQQFERFQNDYYLERGIYYALDYIGRTPAATYPYTTNWPASPSETAHIEITTTEITTPPAHTQYTIKSSTPSPAPAGRQERTITAIYDRGRILSYTASSP